AGFGDSVKTFVGRCLQLQIVCVSYEAFTQTANHMTIRGKVPPREHGFQLIDRCIELLDQGTEFIVIDHRHLREAWRRPCNRGEAAMKRASGGHRPRTTATCKEPKHLNVF